MTTYDWILFLHLLAAFGLIATSLFAHVIYLVARTRRVPGEAGRLLLLVKRVAPFIGPFGLMTLAFGIWLVLEVGYDWGDAWIVISLVFFAIGMVGGPIFGALLAPAGMLAGRLASEGNAETDEVRRALNAPRIVVLAALTAVAPYVILGLMIFKPGLG
jgi:uncharacterized membrane protein